MQSYSSYFGTSIIILVCGLICLYVANKKNLTLSVWTLTGALLGPFAILAVLIKRKNDRLRPQENNFKSKWHKLFKFDLYSVSIMESAIFIISIVLIMYSIFNGGVNVLSTFEALDFIQLFFSFCISALGVTFFKRSHEFSLNVFITIICLYVMNFTSEVLIIMNNPPEDNLAGSIEKLLFIFLKIRTITWVLYAFILKFRHVAGGMSNKNDAHCT